MKNYFSCVTDLGRTKSGFDFERISEEVSNATTIYLHPIFAGNDFTATIGNTSVRVQIQCINKGPRESIKFQVTAVYGSISNSNQTKTIRSTAFIGFNYTPPNSTSSNGKTDRVTVIAKRSVTDETFTQQIPILLLTKVWDMERSLYALSSILAFGEFWHVYIYDNELISMNLQW